MEKKRNNPAKNLPPWRVTSEGDFWNVASRERPAILLPFGGEFQWFGSHWVVPGVYSTAKALVVDFCRQVDVPGEVPPHPGPGRHPQLHPGGGRPH